MSNTQPNAYLRDAVMTASPEQLQLMLYDGAIRFASQGRDAIAQQDHEQAFEKLTRAQRIVLEMERGLRPEIAPELCQRMSALYLFIYRKLVDGCVEHDAAPVDEALELLRFERETWSMLLGKIASESAQITEGAGVAESSPDAAGSLSVEG
jgi:flagellar protein FliS